MKEIKVKLEYKDNIYLSESHKVDDKELDVLQSLLEKIAKGDVSFFKFNSENGDNLYFPKNIIENSIISIVYLS